MSALWSLIDLTVRGAAPLILVALAGLFSERAGLVDIALEGKMLVAAFAAAATASLLHSPWMGLLAGVFAGLLCAMLYAFVCVTCRGNQLVAGISINLLAAGITPVLALAWFHQGGKTPMLAASERFRDIHLPGVQYIGSWPGIGPFYREVLSGHNVLVYFTVLILPCVSWIIFCSRFGLRLRAVGENPHAADASGISVNWVRYLSQVGSGTLCGIAGTYLSVYQTGGFIQNMTAGKGFLALAALIFGKWRPWLAALGCTFFALTDALQMHLEGTQWFGVTLPSELFAMAPYGLTVILLAGFVGSAAAPKGLGQPFHKSTR